ncbi:MAG TPA: diguanylate cyclase [Vicinamibacteria bacterium]|nr:diguanylate cyclase [Vicinamibacteria bacterium]
MSPPSPALDSAVAGAIISLLEDGPCDPTALESKLAALQARWGAQVHTVLLFVLAHLEFPPEKARSQWRAVLRDWKELASRLGEPVDLRVAVLHHFLRRPRTLRNPAIVDLRVLRRTHRSAMLDELTRVHNYRYFQDCVAGEARRAERFGLVVTLLMVDADDFKAYNDAHGHPAGNRALRRLAAVLRRSVRQVDVVARYGGEEFAILLPSTPKLAALAVAEKVRQAVEKADVGAATDASRPITVSIGVASLPGDAASANELVDCADRALYSAKAAGRNRVAAFSPERRDHPRLPAALEGRFTAATPELHPLLTRNLSEGGLAFVTRHPVETGAIARVQLQLPPDHEPLECIMRVVRSTRAADGYHASGAIVHMPKTQAQRYRLFLRALRQAEPAAPRPADAARTRGPAAS